jgi:hypothetical protein
MDWLHHIFQKSPEIALFLSLAAGYCLGFGTQHPSGHVSLANLNESDYRQIGRAVRRLIEE